VIGVLVFIFAATGIFSEIQSSINYIWSVKTKPKRSWVKYITDRLLSLLLVIGMALLLLVTIGLNLFIDLLTGRIQLYFGYAHIALLKWANFGLLFVVVTLVFTIIFKVLPDAKIHWKDALAGSLFTSVLFVAGKFLISYYLHLSKSFNAYGAATSIILILTWVYYSSMILYFGAEFTEVYAKKFGKGIRASRNAVHFVKHETPVVIHKGTPHADQSKN
jgi:membrane protein